MENIHLSLKNDYQVSCDEIDFLIDSSLEFNGWYGGRIMGGGFGGCTINLVDNNLIDQYIDFINRNYRIEFNLELDSDFANIDPKYLSEILIKLDTSGADALFISCTALPALKILNQVETKIKKIVLSSNQTLIWDSIRSVGYKNPVAGYGKLFRN